MPSSHESRPDEDVGVGGQVAASELRGERLILDVDSDRPLPHHPGMDRAAPADVAG
jgi:hypothetical protein